MYSAFKELPPGPYDKSKPFKSCIELPTNVGDWKNSAKYYNDRTIYIYKSTVRWNVENEKSERIHDNHQISIKDISNVYQFIPEGVFEEEVKKSKEKLTYLGLYTNQIRLHFLLPDKEIQKEWISEIEDLVVVNKKQICHAIYI